MLGTFAGVGPIWGAACPSVPTCFGDIDDFLFVGTGTTIAGVFATTADASKYLVTLTNSANMAVVDDVRGGVVRAGVTGTNNDKVSVQENGSPFVCAENKPIHFVARVRTSAIAGMAMGCGLAAKTTTTLLTNTTFATTPADFIGFKVTAVTGEVICVVKGGSTETTKSTGLYFVNDTWKELCFRTREANDGVDFTVDGDRFTIKATLPLTTIGLARIWEGKAQASTAFNLDVDVLGCVQTR